MKRDIFEFIRLDLKSTIKDVFEDGLLLFESKGMLNNYSCFDFDNERK